MEEFTIDVDGMSLATVYHPPADSIRHAALVMCHGFRGSKDGGGRAVELAEKVANLGIGVYRFDFSGPTILSRQVLELAAVVRYIRQREHQPLVLLGRSMGGSTAAIFTATDPAVAGLALWSTPWDLTETFRLALGDGYDRLLAGEDLVLDDEYGYVHLTPEFVADLARFNVLTAIENCAPRPLLIVHGSADAIVPLRQAQAVYHRYRGPKKFIPIVGGDHQFFQGGAAAQHAVLAWLEENF